jgi:2-methylcitrate dehydratase PrpD
MGRRVSGRELIVATAVGVDVAGYLGVVSHEALRFFRPATAGGFGAAAACAKLAGAPAAQIAHAFGLQLAQFSGTMQAHVEASPVLPMQVGFNARAGLQSADLAAAGLTAPLGSLDGPFGYLPLVEGVFDLSKIALGSRWLIAELAHKPYPAGRATHGMVEALMTLRAAHQFGPDDVADILVSGPPILLRLTGRPDVARPSPAYARLCMGYVAAKVLLNGRIGVEHYRGEAQLYDARTHELAAKVRTVEDGTTNHSALAPQTVAVTLNSGEVLRWRCESMLAAPDRRLTRAQNVEKFLTNWSFAHAPLGEPGGFIEAVENLEALDDVASLSGHLEARV